jgi:osmotically-inducible protein OsmY
MLRYRKWVLSLGIMIVAPGITMAGPFSLLRGATSATKPTLSPNQKVAEKVKTVIQGKVRGSISIECKDGVVLLQGKVATAKQKAKATKLISRIKGVKHVENRLVPMDQTGSKDSGKLIQGKMKSRLKSNGAKANEIASALSKAPLTSLDIKVEYKQGAARLTGNAKDMKEREIATRVVSRVPGVVMVDNQLKVKGKAPVRGPIQRVAYNQPPGGPQGAPQGYAPQQQSMPMVGRPPYAPQGPAGMHRPQRVSQPHPGMMAPGGPGPQGAPTSNVYNQPHTPGYAWPSYAASPNYAQVAYPKQYSASAWPYIGPFYPYPQVPLGWRKVQLEWDDGNWNLNFDSRTDKWWWFLNPHNWGE